MKCTANSISTIIGETHLRFKKFKYGPNRHELLWTYEINEYVYKLCSNCYLSNRIKNTVLMPITKSIALKTLKILSDNKGEL